MTRTLLTCALVSCMQSAAVGQGGTWEVFSTSTGHLPSDRVGSMLAEPDGTLWFGTDYGLVRLQDGAWTTFQVDNSDVPSNDISCLSLDAAGRLWVGTRFNGIGIWDGAGWSDMDTEGLALPLNEINSITHDHRGWVWVSTPLGLACRTTAGWRVYDDTEESHGGNQFFLPHVKQVAVRSDDLVSVASLNAGLIYFDETEFIYYTTFNSFFPDNSANAIALDANGDRWLACPAGGLVWHAGDFIGGPWFAYNIFTAGLPDNSMNCIHIDAQDVKLVGTQTAGVLLFRNVNDWSTLGSANSGLPDDNVLSVLRAPDGSLWAGMAGGGAARYEVGLGTGGPVRRAGMEVRVLPGRRMMLEGLPEGRDHTWELLDGMGRRVCEGRSGGGRSFIALPAFLPPAVYQVVCRDADGIPMVGRFLLDQGQGF